MRKTWMHAHALGAAALLIAASSAHAGVSIDRTSQSLAACAFPVTPSNIYRNVPPGGGCDVGGVGPVAEVWEANLGLGMGDNVDALSANTLTAMNLLYGFAFSGDRASLGQPGTAYRFSANLNQAASDLFRTTNPPTLSPLGAMAACATAMIPAPVVNARNQTDYNLIFTQPIGAGPLMGNQDNIDGLELDSFDTTGDQLHDVGVYFSLDAASPSLGGASGATLLFAAPGAPFGIYAVFGQMGLKVNDEVDALVVWDRNQIGAAEPNVDLALFSLAPGSPTLAGPDGMTGTADDLSAAAIFVTSFAGTHCLYLPAPQLGMRGVDNIDGLDVFFPAGGGMGGGD
jgi:hypothetical protein